MFELCMLKNKILNTTNIDSNVIENNLKHQQHQIDDSNTNNNNITTITTDIFEDSQNVEENSFNLIEDTKISQNMNDFKVDDRLIGF